MTYTQKWRIVAEYAARIKLVSDEMMTTELLQEVVDICHRSPSTVKNVWHQFKGFRVQEFEDDVEMVSMMPGHVGKRRSDDIADVEAGIEFVTDEAHSDITDRMMSKRLEDNGLLVSYETAWYVCQQLLMKTISNYIRPQLSDEETTLGFGLYPSCR